MTWGKREPVTNLAILGDAEGNKKKVGGLLIGCPQDRGYPEKVNYELVQQDGEVLTLSGSASLARQIGTADIGRFVKCEFKGWGKSPNGKFKDIEVFVWEDEPTAVMKAWPRWAEFQNGNGAKKPTAVTPSKQPSAPAHDDFEEFPGALENEDEDDLPF